MSRAALPIALLIAFGACATSSGQLHTGVAFAHPSPLSRMEEVARRALPPLAHHRMERELAASHKVMAEQAIDVAHEKFDLYVPGRAPPAAGYGLVVYISPSSAPLQIHDWDGPLEDHRMILVAAQGSGNEANVLNRRVPLALLGYENVRAQYPIDAKRVYVMGFSGGGRIAEMVALAYPDVFHGAVLNAGSDPIDGKDGDTKPPAELFRAFQHSRLVFVTGEEDVDHLAQDDRSRDSLRDNCVLDVANQVALRQRHQPLDAQALERALSTLEARSHGGEDEIDRCNARVDAAVAADLDRAAAAIAHGDRDGARAQLEAIDARFGGLASPRILELADRLAAAR